MDALYFEVDPESNQITIPGSETGFTGNNGGIMAVDCYSLLGEHPSTYNPDADLFEFYLLLIDPGYSVYGVDCDQFVVTGGASGTQKKSFTKGGKTIKEKRAMHTLTLKKR